MNSKRIKSALISVYYKDGLDLIVRKLQELGVRIFSTGGTSTFIEDLGVRAEKVEDLTGYPSILGGRVKTLHPSVFGGILARREDPGDAGQLLEYNIPEIDLVIVDLYPFENTLASGAAEEEIIEKIDIGGISLIRAAAKNCNDVLVVSDREQYPELLALLERGGGTSTASERRHFAALAFRTSSHYDSAIFRYFNRKEELPVFRESINSAYPLRYGENPHQKGVFYGDPSKVFDKLHGKELSYNNLLDLDAAISLIDEFREITFVVIKHNNACGVASRPDPLQAWTDALACDPVSAYGGVIASNSFIDERVAREIDKLFFEIIIAPSYSDGALDILRQKKNRIILARRDFATRTDSYRSLLNGVLWQQRDNSTEGPGDMKTVTSREPSGEEISDLVFANIIVKHSKSNAIVLAKNRQLLASGIGQTSRVDALKQAIEKASSFGFDLKGAVMASDAFFPFPDCVELADKAGVSAVIQPGGSVRDEESVSYCSGHDMAMVFTGVRHFKH